MKIRKSYIVTVILFSLFLMLTWMVLHVDVKPIGPEGSVIGLSTWNLYVFEKIEYNKDLIIKYQYPIQEFIVQILNMLIYIYELSGKYEDNPPIIHYVKKLDNVVRIKDFKLRLLNLLGYHKLCRLNKLIHQIYRHH